MTSKLARNALRSVKKQAAAGGGQQMQELTDSLADGEVVLIDSGLWLVRCHAVRVHLTPIDSAFTASKWEVTKVLRSFVTQKTFRFEVETARSGATASIAFEAAEPAAAFVAAVDGRTIPVSGSRAKASASLAPASGNAALAAGQDWERRLGGAADDAAWAQKPPGKRPDTIVLRGLPAKWVHADKNSEKPSPGLMALLQRVAPVHRAEVARSTQGGFGGDVAGELLAALAPPTKMRSGPLNVDVWVQYATAEGFRRALRLFPSRILRKEAVEAVFPVVVEVDVTGHMSDAAIASRAQEARRALERERQAERDLLAAQGHHERLRDELKQLQAQAAEAISANSASAGEVESPEGEEEPVLPANAAAVMRAAAAAAAAVERAAQRLSELGVAAGQGPGGCGRADGQQAAALVSAARDAISSAASAVREHRSEVQVARNSRLEVLAIRKDAAARGEAAKEFAKLQEDIRAAFDMLPSRAEIPAERGPAEAAMKELGRLCEASGGSAGLADGSVLKGAREKVETLATRAYVLHRIDEQRRRFGKALKAAAEDGEGDAEAILAAQAPPLWKMLVALVLEELLHGVEPVPPACLAEAPLPTAAGVGELMTCCDRAQEHMDLVEAVAAHVASLSRAKRELAEAEGDAAAVDRALLSGESEEDMGWLEEDLKTAKAALERALSVGAGPADVQLNDAAADFEKAVEDLQEYSDRASTAAKSVKEAAEVQAQRQTLRQRGEEAALKAKEEEDQHKAMREGDDEKRLEGRRRRQARVRSARIRFEKLCRDHSLTKVNRKLRMERGPLGSIGPRDECAVPAGERWRLSDGSDEFTLVFEKGAFEATGRPPEGVMPEREPWVLYRLRGRAVVPGQEEDDEVEDEEGEPMKISETVGRFGSNGAAGEGDDDGGGKDAEWERYDQKQQPAAAPAAAAAVNGADWQGRKRRRSAELLQDGYDGSDGEIAGPRVGKLRGEAVAAAPVAAVQVADEDALERLRQQAMRTIRKKKLAKAAAH